MKSVVLFSESAKPEFVESEINDRSGVEVRSWLMMRPPTMLMREGGEVRKPMLAAEGLHPSSKGARVKSSGGKRTVIDGPFTEAKELVAGFWLWQVKSKEEAIEWLKRAPFDGTEQEVEIRQVFRDGGFRSQRPHRRDKEEGTEAPRGRWGQRR